MRFVRRVAVIALLACIAAGFLAAAPASAAAPTCSSWSGGGADSLQAAVRAHQCVTVKPGTWHLSGGIVLPAGHTLTGTTGKESATVLYADPSSRWGCCNGVVDVSPLNSATTANATIAHLTLQGAHRAIIGIAGGYFTARSVRVLSTVCNGMSIFGPRVQVTNSYFRGNGFGRSCPNSPPGAALYVHAVPGYPIGPPTITGNQFVSNGPAVDVDAVDGGRFDRNRFSGNDGWAAIALYRAARWTVTNNTIQQPRIASMGNTPGGNYSYQAACQAGPGGGHPAAIWLCENTSADGHVADHNLIAGNTASSYYGIPLMGADKSSEGGNPNLTPRFNTIRSNVLTGSVIPAADDYRPGQSSSEANVWTANTCSGSTCRPVFF